MTNLKSQKNQLRKTIYEFVLILNENFDTFLIAKETIRLGESFIGSNRNQESTFHLRGH